MPHTTQQLQTWSKLIDTYQQEEQVAIDKLGKPAYEKIFDVQTTTDLEITDTGYAGYGLMVETTETGDAVRDNVIETYTTVYRRKYYRKQADFSKALMQSDRTGKVERMAKGLQNVPMYSRNVYIYGMIRNSFNPAFTWGDGKTLGSIAHPRKDGKGTQPNTFLDGVQRPLTYRNVIEAEKVMISNVSNSGNMLDVASAGRNKILWCSPYLKEEAFQIAGVDGPDKEPNTDTNNANYLRKGSKYDVLVLDYVKYEIAVQAGETTVSKTSSANFYDTMWGIIDPAYTKANFKVIQAEGYPYFDDEIKKSNEVIIKYAYDSFMWGNSSWVGFFVCKGDNSTVII
jgi:hypothetical protein